MKRFRPAAIVAIALAAGCSNGSSTLTRPPVVVTPTPTASPTPTSAALPSGATGASSTTVLASGGGPIALPAVAGLGGSISFPAPSAPFTAGTTVRLTTYAVPTSGQSSAAADPNAGRIKAAMTRATGSTTATPLAEVAEFFSSAVTFPLSIGVTLNPSQQAELSTVTGPIFVVGFALPPSGAPTILLPADPVTVSDGTATFSENSGSITFEPNVAYAFVLYSGTPSGTASPTPAPTATPTPAPPNGAVYAVDSTGTLFSFGSTGNVLVKTKPAGPFGTLNGGGIAVDKDGVVYVTDGQPTNEVSEFDGALNPLSPATVSTSAQFYVPRGIAYDTNDNGLYVANGAIPIAAFSDSFGAPVIPTPGGFPGTYGSSGIAYDSDDTALWVANYIGAPGSGTPTIGVTEYNGDGSAKQTFNYATQFVAPNPHTQPYAIAVCTAHATAGSTEIVVGFIDDGSGQGTPDIAFYTTSGVMLYNSASGVTEPNSLSCSSTGRVYDADVSGLQIFNVTGSNITNTSGATKYTGLTGAVYGVFANF